MSILCIHEFRFEFVDDFLPPFGLIPSYTLVYKCQKCGKWKHISVDAIKNKLSKYKYKNNESYQSEKIILPGWHIDYSYFGKHVGHLVCDYKKKGLDLTAYR